MEKHDRIKAALKKDISYTIQEKSMCFLPGEHHPSCTAGTSLLGNIQDTLKKFGPLYYGLMTIFKPVWRSRQSSRQIKALLNRYGSDAFILNLGSGPRVLQGRSDIINVDLFCFNEVDMIANAADLPLIDDSVDLIVNQAMLEHVTDPQSIIEEMHRILRPGGEIFCYLPFIVPFHAAPFDYQRWTMPGVQYLFQNFDQVEIGIGAGPTSAMLWVMQEWLAILLSFGSKKLHDMIFILMMILTSPIKILDIFLARHPYAQKIASGFYVILKKK